MEDCVCPPVGQEMGRLPDSPSKGQQEVTGGIVTAGGTLAGQFSKQLKTQGDTEPDVFDRYKAARAFIAQSIRHRFRADGNQCQAGEREKRPSGGIAPKGIGHIEGILQEVPSKGVFV